MPVVVALVIAVGATPVAARLARLTGFVDRPGPLKLQTRPIPYLGGLAVMAAIAIPVGLERPQLLIPLGLAALLGLLDDWVGLSARSRLVCEVFIGAIVAVVLPVHGMGRTALALLVVVGLVNAVNLLDGLDGLAPGVGAAAAAGFAIALDAGGARTLAMAMTGALLGFLVWNRPPARIYLGDAGSYLIGTTLAVLLLKTIGPEQALSLAAGSLLFVAVPVSDAAVTIVRRRRAGVPLLHGDRGHVYDQLVDRGLSAPRAAAVCVGGQVVLVVVGLVIVQLPSGPAIAAAGFVIAAQGSILLWKFTSPRSFITKHR